MSLVQLFIQNDAAHDTLHELGNVGVLQFKDLNTEKSAFQRLFVQVRHPTSGFCAYQVCFGATTDQAQA